MLSLKTILNLALITIPTIIWKNYTNPPFEPGVGSLNETCLDFSEEKSIDFFDMLDSDTIFMADNSTIPQGVNEGAT